MEKRRNVEDDARFIFLHVLLIKPRVPISFSS